MRGRRYRFITTLERPDNRLTRWALRHGSHTLPYRAGDGDPAVDHPHRPRPR